MRLDHLLSKELYFIQSRLPLLVAPVGSVVGSRLFWVDACRCGRMVRPRRGKWCWYVGALSGVWNGTVSSSCLVALVGWRVVVGCCCSCVRSLLLVAGLVFRGGGWWWWLVLCENWIVDASILIFL